MKLLLLLLTVVALSSLAAAADITGTWVAEFQTQRGLQRYTFSLEQEGTILTGNASAESNDQKREVELKEGKAEGDTVTFVELLRIQDNELRVTYSGKVANDEIRFTRQVGDLGKSEAVAKRGSAEASAHPAPNPEAAGARAGRRGGFGGPITLGPDDLPVFPAPPDGFDQARDGIDHGKVTMVEYESKSVGSKRKALVYTPPGYAADTKYPVLYLLHASVATRRNGVAGLTRKSFWII